MRNALDEPQTILLLGGTSDIGRAMAAELLSASATTLILACREPGAARADEFAREGLDVIPVAFDAADTAAHDAFIRRLAADHGDIDTAIVAFGVLGDQATFDDDPHAAAQAVHVNYTGAVAVCLALAGQMRRQGHGQIAVLSSVAGERGRASNFVYGSSKAGLDTFAQGLADSLVGTGVQVTVIRPGFVHSRMTEAMDPAPFSAQPADVAKAAVAGMRSGRHTVWAPGILRYVFMVLRHVPRMIFRRLPLG